MKLIGAMLFGWAMLTGYLLPKGDIPQEPALEIDCPNFSIIAVPADNRVTVAKAHSLAECLGDEQSMVCTIATIRLHRNKGETK